MDSECASAGDECAGVAFVQAKCLGSGFWLS